MLEKKVYLRESLLALTKDVCCALILDCLINKTDAGEKGAVLTFSDINNLCMLGKSDATIKKYVDKLIKMGLIKYVPMYGMRYYHLCVENIKKALADAGYNSKIDVMR